MVNKEGKLLIGDGHFKMSGNADAVKAAGTISIDSKGKISSFTNNSGHFKSGEKGLQNLSNELSSRGLINDKTPSLNVGRE